jgi:hypothetical protein
LLRERLARSKHCHHLFCGDHLFRKILNDQIITFFILGGVFVKLFEDNPKKDEPINEDYDDVKKFKKKGKLTITLNYNYEWYDNGMFDYNIDNWTIERKKGPICDSKDITMMLIQMLGSDIDFERMNKMVKEGEKYRSEHPEEFEDIA